MFLRMLLPMLLLVSLTTAQERKSATPEKAKPAVQKATPLIIDWVTPPHLNVSSISGTLFVSNQTDNDFDQTVIILAVNEVGKAFALGYQRFTMARHSRSIPISFGMTLPPGRYAIHADAIAEVASKGAIYRARLQTDATFVVTEI